MEYGLTLKDRRKIYENAISVIIQANKIKEKFPVIEKNKSGALLIDNQLDGCAEMIATTLGLEETTVRSEDGTTHVIVSLLGDELVFKKSDFQDVVIRVSKDKAFKEALWKRCIKRDNRSKTKFAELI